MEDTSPQPISNFPQQIFQQKEIKELVQAVQAYKPTIQILKKVETQQNPLFQSKKNNFYGTIKSQIFNGFDQSNKRRISLKLFQIEDQEQENHMNYFIQNHLNRLNRQDLVLSIYDHYSIKVNEKLFMIFEMEIVEQQFSLYLLNQKDQELIQSLSLLDLPVRYLFDRVKLQQIGNKEEIFPSITLFKNFSSYFFIQQEQKDHNARIKFDSLNPQLFLNETNLIQRFQQVNLNSGNDNKVESVKNELEIYDQETKQLYEDINKTSTIIKYSFEVLKLTIPITEIIQSIEQTNPKLFEFHSEELLKEIINLNKYGDFELLEFGEFHLEFGTKQLKGGKDVIIRLEKFQSIKEAQTALDLINSFDEKYNNMLLPIYHLQILSISGVFYLLQEEQRIKRYVIKQNDEIINISSENKTKANKKELISIFTQSLYYLRFNNSFFSKSEFVSYSNQLQIQLLLYVQKSDYRQQLNSNNIFIQFEYSQSTNELTNMNILIRRIINRQYLSNIDSDLLKFRIKIENYLSFFIEYNNLTLDQLTQIYNQVQGDYSERKNYNFQQRISQYEKYKIDYKNFIKSFDSKQFNTQKLSQIQTIILSIIIQLLQTSYFCQIKQIKKSENYRLLKQQRQQFLLQQDKQKNLTSQVQQQMFRYINDTLTVDIESCLSDCQEFTLNVLKKYKRVTVQLFDLSILELLNKHNSVNNKVEYLAIKITPYVLQGITLSKDDCKSLIMFIQFFSKLKSLTLNLNATGEMEFYKLSQLTSIQEINIMIIETYYPEEENSMNQLANIKQLFQHRNTFKNVSIRLNNQKKYQSMIDSHWNDFLKNSRLLQVKNNSREELQKLYQDLNIPLLISQQYPSIQFEIQQLEQIYKISISDTTNSHLNKLSFTLLKNGQIDLEKNSKLKLACLFKKKNESNFLDDQLIEIWWKNEFLEYMITKNSGNQNENLCYHNINLYQTSQLFQGQKNLQKIHIYLKICNSMVEELQSNKSLFSFESNQSYINLTIEYEFQDLNWDQANILKYFAINLRNNNKITILNFHFPQYQTLSNIKSLLKIKKVVVLNLQRFHQE